MKNRPIQSLRVLTLLMIGLLGAASGRAQLDKVTQATHGGEPLALVRLGGELGLMTPAGTLEPLLVPPTTSLDSIEPLDDGWIAVGSRWQAGQIDLHLLRELDGRRVEVLPPGGFQGAPRLSPRLVVGDGGLAGLVWLEGHFQHETSVWAAAWNGTGWGEPELVSPEGPGAQLAPSVTVLADGSWLLVWSAVDGQDDEILWSQRRQGSWTTPTRIHSDNSVPDVTPVVTAVRGGAVAVWSFLEGRHFRLLSARFDGEGWTLGKAFGDKGSHRPRFFAREGRPALLYRTSVPAGWAVVDCDASGREVRRAFLARSHAAQPMVDFRLAEEVRFLLPDAEGVIPSTEELSRWETPQ